MTSVQVKAQRLLFGMRLCMKTGFNSFQVELDSLVMVHIGQGQCPWKIR